MSKIIKNMRVCGFSLVDNLLKLMLECCHTSLLQESIFLNRQYDLNQTADSSNLDDQEVDLELKL